MRNLKCFTVLSVCLVLTSLVQAEAITSKGQKLVKVLDQMDVENHWLPGRYVKWESGDPLNKEVVDGKPHTHCSAFAAAAAKKLGVYLLRPKGPGDPPGVEGHQETLLADAQFDWLNSHKCEKLGWRNVASPVEAQKLANEGHLVVATYREADAKKPGHIAIVRPHGDRTDAQIEADGPQIIQAGMKNAASTTLRSGFSHHNAAWETGRGVRFFVHALDLP